jgi:hypothetical protein
MMPNLTEASEKLLLDWVLNGAVPTRPPGCWIGLSLGTPTSRTGSEVQAASGYARQTGTFGAANSPAGTASNNNPMTFGPFLTSAAIQGVLIWDTSAINSGTMLWQGTLQTARTVLSGDTINISAGALTCGLS